MHLIPPFIRRSFSKGGENISIQNRPDYAGLFYNILLRDKNRVKLTTELAKSLMPTKKSSIN